MQGVVDNFTIHNLNEAFFLIYLTEKLRKGRTIASLKGHESNPIAIRMFERSVEFLEKTVEMDMWPVQSGQEMGSLLSIITISAAVTTGDSYDEKVDYSQTPEIRGKQRKTK